MISPAVVKSGIISCGVALPRSPKPRNMCCKGPGATATGSGLGEIAAAKPLTSAGTHDAVKEYYGKVLSTSKDLKTSACTAGGQVIVLRENLLYVARCTAALCLDVGTGRRFRKKS